MIEQEEQEFQDINEVNDVQEEEFEELNKVNYVQEEEFEELNGVNDGQEEHVFEELNEVMNVLQEEQEFEPVIINEMIVDPAGGESTASADSSQSSDEDGDRQNKGRPWKGRKRNYPNQTREIRKKRKNSNKKYISQNGKTIHARLPLRLQMQ